MSDILSSVFVLIGATFILLASIGLVRMPDLYMRLQTLTKAVTLGAGGVLVGFAIYFGSVSVVTRVILVIAFLALTVPISAHMISRAAYIVRIPLWEGTIIDELGDDLRQHLVGDGNPSMSELEGNDIQDRIK